MRMTVFYTRYCRYSSRYCSTNLMFLNIKFFTVIKKDADC